MESDTVKTELAAVVKFINQQTVRPARQITKRLDEISEENTQPPPLEKEQVRDTRNQDQGTRSHDKLSKTIQGIQHFSNGTARQLQKVMEQLEGNQKVTSDVTSRLQDVDIPLLVKRQDNIENQVKDLSQELEKFKDFRRQLEDFNKELEKVATKVYMKRKLEEIDEKKSMYRKKLKELDEEGMNMVEGEDH